MKIYTKTGDDGTTSLYDGSRVQKWSPVLKIIGSIDLLSSNIGLLISITPVVIAPVTPLRIIQCKLQDINSILATPSIEKCKKLRSITIDDVKWLENLIDNTENENTPLRDFILPGLTHQDSQSHICRSVCRQAEQQLHEYADNYALPNELLQYMNRLSDFFFVYARWLSMKYGRIECKAKDYTKD